MRVFALVTLVLLGSSCFKQREDRFRFGPGTCRGPEIPLDIYFQPSTAVVTLNSAVTEYTVDYSWSITTSAGTDLDKHFIESVLIAADGVHYESVTAVAVGDYSYTITNGGVYRAAISATTCQGITLSAQAFTTAKITFPPIFKITFSPSIEYSLNVGTEVEAEFEVADRDGSTLFQLTWDFDVGGAAGARGKVNRWNRDENPIVHKKYKYNGSGILTFRASVTDEQGDTRELVYPVLVGAPVALYSSNSVNMSGSGAVALSVTDPARSLWAVVSRSIGLRIYELLGDDVHVRTRGQFADSVLSAVEASDIAYDAELGIGYLTVAGTGVYLVDMRDLDHPRMFNPPRMFRPSGRPGMGILLTMARLVAGKRYLIVHNSAVGETYIIRINRSLAASLISGGNPLGSAFCEITDGGLAEPCAPANQLVTPLTVGPVQDIAWFSPYLALAGDRDRFHIVNASNALTDSTPPGGYSVEEVSAPWLPSRVESSSVNRSLSVTVATVSGDPDRVTFYVAHGEHGVALYQLYMTGGEAYLPDAPRDNFYALKEKGLLTGVAADAFLTADMHQGRAVLGQFAGGTDNDNLLLFNQTEWTNRSLASAYFHYEYVRKCNPDDIAGVNGDGLFLYDPLTYLEDCTILENPANVEIADNEAIAVRGSGFAIVSLGTAPSMQGDSHRRIRVDFASSIFDIDVVGNNALMARGLAGIERWDLGPVLAGTATQPILKDGIFSGQPVDRAWYAGDNTGSVWTETGKTLSWYPVGADGRVAWNPVTSQTFPFVPSEVIMEPKRALALEGAQGAVVELDLTAAPTTATGLRSVEDDYVEIRKNGSNLIATRMLTDGVEYDWLQSATLDQQYRLRVPFEFAQPGMAPLATGSRIAVVTVSGRGTEEVTSLRIFAPSGQQVVETGSVTIPVSFYFALEGIGVRSVGDYIGILIKGQRRGMYLFTSDSQGKPIYIGSNLYESAYNMSDFRPFLSDNRLAILAYSLDGAKIGTLNLFVVNLAN